MLNKNLPATLAVLSSLTFAEATFSADANSSEPRTPGKSEQNRKVDHPDHRQLLTEFLGDSKGSNWWSANDRMHHTYQCEDFARELATTLRGVTISPTNTNLAQLHSAMYLLGGFSSSSEEAVLFHSNVLRQVLQLENQPRTPHVRALSTPEILRLGKEQEAYKVITEEKEETEPVDPKSGISIQERDYYLEHSIQGLVFNGKSSVPALTNIFDQNHPIAKNVLFRALAHATHSDVAVALRRPIIETAHSDTNLLCRFLAANAGVMNFSDEKDRRQMSTLFGTIAKQLGERLWQHPTWENAQEFLQSHILPYRSLTDERIKYIQFANTLANSPDASKQISGLDLYRLAVTHTVGTNVMSELHYVQPPSSPGAKLAHQLWQFEVERMRMNSSDFGWFIDKVLKEKDERLLIDN